MGKYPYKLTEQQIADGWRIGINQGGVEYFYCEPQNTSASAINARS